MDNKTMLLVLMVVLIAFIVLMVVLGVVFIVALRKRAPVVKVLMAPLAAQAAEEEDEPEQQPQVQNSVAAVGSSEAQTPPPPVMDSEPDDDEPEEEDETTYVTEGQERVRYDRSLTAKIAQLKHETKDWYSELKNEILSYERVKDRMSWKRETFRIGRMTVARIVVRGKTLCLMLAVEPAGYAGTKYAVEDVSNVASTADTPTLFRIKSVRRLKYAKEMLAGIMKELKIYKDSHYEAKDFFVPYEGDMALMQRGLVKRVVTGTTRTFKIEEVDKAEAEAAAEAAAVNAEASAESTEAPAEAKPAAPKASAPKSSSKSKSKSKAPKPAAEEATAEAPAATESGEMTATDTETGSGE